MRVVYMAHPVSGDVEGNLLRAERWMVWLQAVAFAPGHAVIAPWLHELRVLRLSDQEPEARELALRRCEAVAALCDAVVLCGGRISEGMGREARAARDVIDLTGIGPMPPDGGGE